MENSNDWETNFHYIESQLNKLVRSGKRFSFCIIDEYGNKTNYFNINQEQFEIMGKVLKNIN